MDIKTEKTAPTENDQQELKRLLEKIARYRRSKGMDMELTKKILEVNFSQDGEILSCQCLAENRQLKIHEADGYTAFVNPETVHGLDQKEEYCPNTPEHCHGKHEQPNTSF